MSELWEVEQKFRVDDRAALLSSLENHGFLLERTESHCDEYFRHPSRDFRKTDEALRLRRINDKAVVTYKGPRESAEVKTRQEIELSILSSDYGQWGSMLSRLGFVPTEKVEKQRQVYKAARQPSHDPDDVIITVDDVSQLGTFAEVELIASSRDDLLRVQSIVKDTAEALGLRDLERRSYLAMLLSKLGIE